jgi:hypothetical protein
MLRAGCLRRVSAGLVLAAATLGTAGCVLTPVPGPIAYGPPVVVAPRPVIVVPRPFLRSGYHGHWRHHRHGHRWH